MKLHHIGIATTNIEDTIERLKNNTDIESVSQTVYDPEQNANLCMVKIKYGTDIELIQGEVVSKMIKKGHYLYHLCWETEDIEAQIQQLINAGGMVVTPLKKSVLFDGRRVAFVMTNLGLTELVESYLQ